MDLLQILLIQMNDLFNILLALLLLQGIVCIGLLERKQQVCDFKTLTYQSEQLHRWRA